MPCKVFWFVFAKLLSNQQKYAGHLMKQIEAVLAGAIEDFCADSAEQQLKAEQSDF